MKLIFSKYILSCFLLSILFVSCADKWDDHIGITDPDSQKTLYDIVKSSADFSTFADMVDKAGYGEELQSSKNYTLIVPTNSAIESVRNEYDFSDTTVIRSFVGYHIINSIYNVNNTADTVRARNLRSKYVEFIDGEFDGVKPNSENIVASNGIYHVVSQPLKPLQHIFNFVTTEFSGFEQVKAILSFDTAYVEGEATLYHINTSWLNEVRRHMTNEARKYTYFVVEDDFYTQKYQSLRPFYHTHYDEVDMTRPDSTTTFFTKKALLKDFLVIGEFNLNNLPSEFTSVGGTNFKLDPADIIRRTKTSNGIVYHVRKLQLGLSDQIKEIQVLGQQPIGYKQTDKRGNTYFRNKRDNEGNLYNDIQVHGHGVTAFYIKYRALNTNAVRYKVYARGIVGLPGDPQTAAFTQYLHFFNPAMAALPIEPDQYRKQVLNASTALTDTRMTFQVDLLNHAELYLGEVTQDEFGTMRFILMSNGTGPLILEYVRFVPILP